MTSSTRRSFILGAGCAALAASAAARGAATSNRTPALEADPEVRRLIDRERQNIIATMAREDIPGAAICLVSEGRPVWIEGFGVTDRQSNRPIDLDTIFSIQSTSKNMTTTAIMLAAQRGLLDLDKPITAYLPSFTVNSRFETRPQDRITLRHLVSNRAGFTHEAPVGNSSDMSFPSFEAHVDSISQTWLRSPVGERYRYSNLGFDLAGYILQTVAKKPFTDCLKTMLFDPLGMSDATADADNYVQRANRAIGHRNGYESVPLRLPFIPAGGVYASAHDLATYLCFHLDKGALGQRRLLQENRWDEMHSFALGGAYSLGVFGGQLRFGDTDLWMLLHPGSGCGFRCMFRFYPRAKLGLGVLVNADGGAENQWGVALIDEILTRRYGERRARIQLDDFTSAKLPRPELEKFVGNWVVGNGRADFRLQNGQLVMQRGGRELPVRTVSAVNIATLGTGSTGEAVEMRYFPASNGATAHLASMLGDEHMDYNDGPNDPPGPNKEEWDRHVGQYWLHIYGKPTARMSVTRKNGYLYLNGTRLVEEFRPGLFFTADGEAVDFRHEAPTWQNLPLRRAAE